MALRETTVEYVFQSLTSSNVTMPAVAPFQQIAPFIPAGTNRVFKNVFLLIAGRHHDSFLANGTNWEVGVSLDGGTFVWYRQNSTYFNSGEHFWWYQTQDITDQWQAAWSSTTKETGTVSGAFCFSGGAWVMGNFQGKLFITYEYDDNNQPLSGTLLKTVRIPIQSKTSRLTTTAEEFGGAGSWSIPVLNDFLPETGKTIQDVWVEFFSSDASGSTAAFSMFWQFNGATERRLFAQNQDTNISLLNWYILKLHHPTISFPSHLPPRLLIRGDDATTNRYNTCGGWLGVTYRYSAASSRSLQSVLLPMGSTAGYVGSGSTGYSRVHTTLNVQEPGPIVVKNSAVMMTQIDSADITTNLRFGSMIMNPVSSSQGSYRTYSTFAGSLTAGSHVLTHRIDSGALAGTGLVLDRGENRLWTDWYGGATTASNGGGSAATALAVINYESSCSISGVAAHNHTTTWTCISGTTTASWGPQTQSGNSIKIPRWVHPPTMSGSAWYLSNCGFWVQNLGRYGNQSFHLHMETDDLNNTFVPVHNGILLSENENTTFLGWYEATQLFWRHRQEPLTGSYMDPRKERQFKLQTTGYSWQNMWFLLTTHNIGYPVTASVRHYRDSAEGIKVNILSTATKTLLYQTSSNATGSYSFLAYDNVTPIYAHATQSATHVGTSEVTAPSTIPNASLT